MAGLSCMISLTFILLISTMSNADDCTEATQQRFNACYMLNYIQNSETTEPRTRSQRCSYSLQMKACVDEARDSCPSLPLFNEQNGYLDDLTAQINTYCSDPETTQPSTDNSVEETENECSDPLGQLNICIDLFPQGPLNTDQCPIAQEFILCLEDLEARCPTGAKELLIGESITRMRDIMANRLLCGTDE